MTKLQVPFSPPMITEEMINEVVKTLRTGWISTGPQTKQLERDLTDYLHCTKTLCVGSATQGMELVLRWLGVGPGDEVIIPAYTYCATANVVVHVGATPVMVDIDASDMCIDVDKVAEAITSKTKAIIPVDLAGMPARQDLLLALVESVRAQFSASSENQKKLGRIMIMTDAAHSIGATLNGQMIGSISDVTVFSFHAVKNLTTAEGGAIAFNLPNEFDHEEVYRHFNTNSLHGQSKDALAKTQSGQWRYDVEEPGYKANMTDIQASLGLVQLKYYPETLKRRKEIFDLYSTAFSKDGRLTCPINGDEIRSSSCHFYALRLNGFSEDDRNRLIALMAEDGVSANVHYLPLPMLTAYKKRGYKVEDYPIAFETYKAEITLPVFNAMTDEQVKAVITSLFLSLDKLKA